MYLLKSRLLYSVVLTGLCMAVPAKPQTTTSGMTHSNNSSTQLTVDSSLSFPYTVIDQEVSMLEFNYTFHQEARAVVGHPGWIIVAFIHSEKIADVVSDKEIHIEAANFSGSFSVSVKGKLPGRATLEFRGKDRVNSSTITAGGVSRNTTGGVSKDTASAVSHSDVDKYGEFSFELYVERREKAIDMAFNVIVVILVVLTNIGMGAKVDLSVVKAQLKRPFAPAIGLFSQFVFMPLIAFTVVSILKLDPGVALGLFALGCSPGGSASNAYTFLLDGNVSLSITMTLISTLASLGLLPMWLFTLGRIVYREAKVKIPFENIFFSLIGIIIPVILGIFLQRKYPKVANFCIKAVKYIMILFILFILTVGVYANFFIFSLMTGEVLLASALLPYVGFLLGGLAAFIGHQDLANIITIAVETGIQNTGIPIVLLRLSLKGPDKDTSIVSPVASAIFTPLPLIFGILFVQIRKRVKEKRAASQKSGAARDRPSPPAESEMPKPRQPPDGDSGQIFAISPPYPSPGDGIQLSSDHSV